MPENNIYVADGGFVAVINQPMEFILAVVAALLLTELIKLPIKYFTKKSTGIGWLYILISIAVVTGVYLAYYNLIRPVESGTFYFDYEDWLSMVAAEQLTFNFIWDKGIKKAIALIVAKFSKKSLKEVEGFIENSKVGGVLDKVDSHIKSDSNNAEAVELTKAKQLSVGTEKPKMNNGRPNV